MVICTDILKYVYKIDTADIEKNEESTDGNVYIIRDKNNKKYALKIYESEDHAISMVKLHTYLKNNSINVPDIIKAAGKSYVVDNGKYFVLYSFINGNKIKNIQLDDNIIIDIAVQLRNIHSLKNEDIKLKKIPFNVDLDRQSILHFDITKNNIFLLDEKIYFIDFDDAKYGPAICDIAIAITNLFISKANGADINGMKLFIDSYYKNDENIKQKEVPLIGKIACEWIKSVINKQNIDTSIKAGLENKLYWMNKIWSEQWIN